MLSQDRVPSFDEESAGEIPDFIYKEIQLADFLTTEETNVSMSDICYELSYETLSDEDTVRLLLEFLELYPNWQSRQVQFHTEKNNIPLVSNAHVIIEMPDFSSVEIRLPLYQFDVKANSEELWRIFKMVMKGERNGPSWVRDLDHFSGLHRSNHYHVRRIETAEVKRQAVLDFIARYSSVGVKSIPVKQDHKKFYPWFMLNSKESSGPVRLCVVIDNDSLEKNHAQFFELANLFKNRPDAVAKESSSN